MENKKKFSDTDVAGIVKELRRRENGLSQVAFAEFLNKRDPKPENEDDVRFVRTGDIQRLESGGSTLRGQFALFLKLIPLCVAHGIIGAHDLLSPELYERFKHLENGKSLEAKTGQRREIKEKSKRNVR